MMNLEVKGVQILTGTAGKGKSRNSLEILRQYSAKHAGYHGIKLQKVQEWRDLICKDDLLVVLCDNIFGQTSFNFITDDEHIFETINYVIEVESDPNKDDLILDPSVTMYIRRSEIRRIVEIESNPLMELYIEYLRSKIDLHHRLLYFQTNWDYEVGIRPLCEGFSPCLRLMDSFLTSLLFHSLKYTDNDDAITQILKYMEHDLQVGKHNCAHIGYENCLTNGILQACVDMNERRLSMLLDFVKRYKNKWYSFDIHQNITVPMLRFLSSNSKWDAIDKNMILFKAIEYHDIYLVKLLFKRQDATDIVIAPAMIHACTYDIASVLQTALRENNINIVKSVLKYTSKEILDTILFSKIEGISLLTSLLEAFTDTNSESTIKSAPCYHTCRQLLTWYSRDNMNLCKLSQIFHWACKQQHTETVYWLLQNFGQQGLHLNSALQVILTSKNGEYLQYLLKTVDTSIFDIQAVINHVCFDPMLSQHNLSWMLRYYNISHSMMAKILQNACDNVNTALVQFILEECNSKEFDMRHLMTNACQQGSLKLVQLIYRFYSLASLSLETVFTHACGGEKHQMYQNRYNNFLNRNFEIDMLDLATICTMFCSNNSNGMNDEIRLQFQLCFVESYTYEAIDIVDIEFVFDQICSTMEVKEAEWIVSLFDHKRLNFISATVEAIQSNNTATALFLLKSMNDKDLKK
ncbi:unnamed protein product [Mytilus edulis]|uniref:Novel STAND NTPase 3 domain-containing protein n=1 Tax=Mytilus edulis TaxID=6550 RepID=A0A8S3S0E3_MYTED|nr:unnamed protein product [Mytilus edulis]